MDGVQLEFQEEALRSVAQQAIKRETGARGLRAIFEDIMMDTMFEIPSREDVEKCIITKETVEHKEHPLLVTKGSLRQENETA